LYKLNPLDTTTFGGSVYPLPPSVRTISKICPPYAITSAFAPPPVLFSGIKCKNGGV
jgi:hypothetical protein